MEGDGEAAETRRFGLADVMILVVATAVGLAPLRVIWKTMEGPQLPRSLGWGVIASSLIPPYAACASPLVLSWTVAALALAVRRPGPPPGVLIRRPGVVLGLAALAGVAHTAMILVPIWHADGYSSPRSMAYGAWSGIGCGSGFYILGAWVALLCIGLPRHPPGWVDLLGRALSFCWLAEMMAVHLQGLLPALQ